MAVRKSSQSAQGWIEPTFSSLGLRPRIVGQPLPDFVVISRVNEMECLPVVANWAADQDEAVRDEAVHERRMCRPSRLLADVE